MMTESEQSIIVPVGVTTLKLKFVIQLYRPKKIPNNNMTVPEGNAIEPIEKSLK